MKSTTSVATCMDTIFKIPFKKIKNIRMVNEMEALVWTDDLFSGRALPLLLNLQNVQVDIMTVLWLIPIGGIIPAILQWATSYLRSSRPLMWPHAAHITLQFLSASLKLGTNLSTLFACAHNIEPYVGATLCIVPALTLICMKGIEHNRYANYMRICMTLSALALLIYSCFKAKDTYTDLHTPQTPWLYVRLLLNAAYACNDINGKTLTNILIRSVIYIVVGSTSSVLSAITTCHSSLLGFFLKTVLLMQSSMVQSGIIKQCLGKLGTPRQSRTHLIIISAITSTAFTLRDDIAINSSIAVGILYILYAVTRFWEYIDGQKSAITIQ